MTLRSFICKKDSQSILGSTCVYSTRVCVCEVVVTGPAPQHSGSVTTDTNFMPNSQLNAGDLSSGPHTWAPSTLHRF